MIISQKTHTANNKKTPTRAGLWGAAVEWYCVQIERQRLSRVINLTFRNMLIEEYRDLGEPDNCRVYRQIHPDGSYTYLFSPGAAEAMKIFVNFWEGTAVAEPTTLHQMEVII